MPSVRREEETALGGPPALISAVGAFGAAAVCSPGGQGGSSADPPEPTGDHKITTPLLFGASQWKREQQSNRLRPGCPPASLAQNFINKGPGYGDGSLGVLEGKGQGVGVTNTGRDLS